MNIKDIPIRDPYIYVEDGVAYMVGTTAEAAWGGKRKGFCGYKSRDLVNFEGPFVLFEAGEGFWADQDFWAAELHKYNGKYCLFISCKAEGKCRASQVLTCDTPFGTYVPAAAPLTPEDWECLDATLYEEDGVAYTVYCHEWLQCRDGEMILARLKEELDGTVEEPQLLFKATEAPWIAPLGDGNYITDGPFLRKQANGSLLMLWSSFSSTGYALSMAVSKHGIRGPWRQIEQPLFRNNGGHGMVFDFAGKTYVALHCPNDPDGAERACFYPVEEDGDILRIVNR